MRMRACVRVDEYVYFGSQAYVLPLIIHCVNFVLPPYFIHSSLVSVLFPFLFFSPLSLSLRFEPMWFAVFVGFRCLMLLIGSLVGGWLDGRRISIRFSPQWYHFCCAHFYIDGVGNLKLCWCCFCCYVFCFWEQENMRPMNIGTDTVIRSLYRRTLSGIEKEKNRFVMGNFVSICDSPDENVYSIPWISVEMNILI